MNGVTRAFEEFACGQRGWRLLFARDAGYRRGYWLSLWWACRYFCTGRDGVALCVLVRKEGVRVGVS